MLRLQWFQSAPRVVQGLMLGVAVALLVGALGALGWLRGLERGAMDATFRARGPRYPSPHVTLLVADDASVARANRWPLPWSVHADIVRRLHRAGAKTIAFDLLFSTPSYAPHDDAEFVRACRQAGNVVQAVAFHLPATYSPSLPVSTSGDGHMLPGRFRVRDDGARCLSAVSVTAALPALQKSAPALGHINVYPEADGALRRIPHLIRYRGGVYPSLALAAAAHFLDLRPRDIAAGEGAARLPVLPSSPLASLPSLAAAPLPPTLHLPLDEHGEAWINWAGRNGTFPTYSFNQLFDGRVPPEALRGRVVLIGTTAAGTFEHRATPFSPAQPAVEMQADALDDILSYLPLRQVPAEWQALLLLGFAVLSGALTAPRRALAGTLWIVALGVALWQAAALAMSRADLYIPIASPLLAGALTYTLATALNYRREWEANWRADSAVAALARGGALMASVRDRGRLHAVIRQTAREAVSAREVLLLLNGEPQSEARRELARRIGHGGQPILWPSRGIAGRLRRAWLRRPTLSRRASMQPDLVLDELLENLSQSGESSASVQRNSSGRKSRPQRAIVAVPLPEGTGEFADDSAREYRSGGALIALGRQDGAAFTARDAALLETLAKQAALALEHLEYYERLRGRVELANRDLREAYALLAEQSVKLSAAVESIDDALIVSDESGRAIFMNPASRRILGGAAPTLGQFVPDALNAGGLNELAALFHFAAPAASARNGTLRDGASQASQNELLPIGASANGVSQGEAQRDPTPGEKALHNGNGTYREDETREGKIVCEVVREMLAGDGADEGANTARRILTAQFTPLESAEGRSLGAMLVVADVTAQRELDAMKSDFVSFVAHELRTPLTSILGYASLLQKDRGQFEPAQRTTMTDEIMRQCSRLNRMISELLDVSRLQAGRGIVLRPATVDVAALCERVLAGARAALYDPQFLTLEFRCDHRPLHIVADADRLEQIVTNLVSNAVKYSPDGGAVTLDLQRSGDAVTLSVADTGMGMTPQQQEQLFQKFYRTPDAQARGIKGTGLGLFLVKQLVEAHEGRIEVHSESGRGTTFTVTLPAEPVGSPALPSSGLAVS